MPWRGFDGNGLSLRLGLWGYRGLGRQNMLEALLGAPLVLSVGWGDRKLGCSRDCCMRLRDLVRRTWRFKDGRTRQSCKFLGGIIARHCHFSPRRARRMPCVTPERALLSHPSYSTPPDRQRPGNLGAHSLIDTCCARPISKTMSINIVGIAKTNNILSAKIDLIGGYFPRLEWPSI